MKLTRFKLAFLSYALFDLLIGGHCGGLLPLGDIATAQMSPVQGNITAASASCLSTNCVTAQLDGSTGAATIQLSGTFSLTAQFEVSNDNGSTFASLNCTPANSTTAASSATATGLWQCNVAGFTHIRVRGSAYTSGTAVVYINSARASAKSGGGAVYASGLGTSNVIPKGNGAGQLADSSITDNGTTVTTTELIVPVAASSATVVSGVGSASNGSGFNINSTQIQFMQSAVRIGAFAAADFSLATNARISWSNTSNDALGSATDTFLRKRSTANIAFGAADLNGAPVAQTVSVQNAITGSNLPGASTFSLVASLGTGTGTPGMFQVSGAAVAASGTTAQTAISRFALNDTKQLTSGAASTAVSIPLATLQMAGGTIDYYIEATDGTNQCTRAGVMQYTAENSAGVFVTQVTDSAGALDATACTATKTLTVAWAVTGANPALVQVTPTTNIAAPTLFQMVYEVHHKGQTAPTL